MSTEPHEHAGEAVRSPKVPEVLDRFRAYVNQPGNSVGGSLHIVLDDGNVKDADVEHCIEWAEEAGDTEGVELGRLMLAMSRTQRARLASLVWRT